jgi:hypothetical protein
MTEDEIEAIRARARSSMQGHMKRLGIDPNAMTPEDTEQLRLLEAVYQTLAEEGEEKLAREGRIAPVDLYPDKPKN